MQDYLTMTIDYDHDRFYEKAKVYVIFIKLSWSLSQVIVLKVSCLIGKLILPTYLKAIT